MLAYIPRMGNYMWTWSGTYYGARFGNSLFSHDGTETGRFHGREVYGPDGMYMGELDNDFLVRKTAKGRERRKTFIPRNQLPLVVYGKLFANPFKPGFEDFPAASGKKKAVRRSRVGLLQRLTLALAS